MKVLATAIALTLIAVNCSNYGLYDKMANPASITNSGSGISLQIFVGSTLTDGSMAPLASAGAAMGCSGTGFAAADCYCNFVAVSNGIAQPGQMYIAWLSTGSGAITPLDMTCRIQGMSGVNCSIPQGSPTWKNRAGQVVANGYAQLFSGNLANAIQYDQTGAPLSSTSIFTATSMSGNSTGTACGNTPADWSSTGGSTATTGSSTATNANWTNMSTSGSCATPMSYVYCLGRP
ncbi:MAG: hypothetical protein JSR44_08460 [Spirochaetes bacterium]|nr:hypothetical protein [Spirochaetota bacterium]